MEIEKALNFLRDTAKDYSIAKGQAEFLKEFRKSKKAMLMIEAEKKGITAVNRQEVFAYAHDEYVELIDGLQAAIEKEAYLRHMVKAAELKIEVWRTQQSTMRAEMKGYNYGS